MAEISECPWFHAVNGRCLEHVSDTPVGPWRERCGHCGKVMVIPPTGVEVSPLSPVAAQGFRDLWETLRESRLNDHPRSPHND